MGLVDWWRRLFDRDPEKYDLDELARRLGVDRDSLLAIRPTYREFTVAKPSGGRRLIAAPDPELKQMQRRINRRLLQRLPAHACAMGFEQGRSIVTNAAAHTQKAVLIRLDMRNFFPATSAKRVHKYLRTIGWSKGASALLVRLCTWRGGLPQGAPTSPRLSNLVNYQLDARLAGWAENFRLLIVNPFTGNTGKWRDEGKVEVTYTRYVDDLVFSLAKDNERAVKAVIAAARRIVGEYGYRLHGRKKMRIRRRHQSQEVTGLVVNQRVNLPRRTRRWLRAVDHHIASGRESSLTPSQLAGWRALEKMIETQAQGKPKS